MDRVSEQECRRTYRTSSVRQGEPSSQNGQIGRRSEPGSQNGQAGRRGEPDSQHGQAGRRSEPGSQNGQAGRRGEPGSQHGQAGRRGEPGSRNAQSIGQMAPGCPRTPRSRISHQEMIRRKRRRRRRQRILRGLSYCLVVVLVFVIGFLVGRGMTLVKNQVQVAVRNQAEKVAAKTASSVGIAADIYLDPGHGGKDQGTSYGEILEKDLNLQVTKKVKALLEQDGYSVGLTRETDEQTDLYSRAYMANDAAARVYVSIHCNFLESGQADGIEIYYDAAKEESQALGEDIMSQMTAQTGAQDRGVRTEDFAVTRETSMPAVLVELGYLSDAVERANLILDSYQDKLARGIADGIEAYLKTDMT